MLGALVLLDEDWSGRTMVRFSADHAEMGPTIGIRIRPFK
jgi:hypothetical protein